MTVGYKIAGGTDLDDLFAARVSAAAANVGYKDSSSVDLSNRYEPRGSTTPIPNTGYKNSASVDLAQIFKDKAAGLTLVGITLTSGTYFESSLGRTNTGYAAAALIATGQPAMGSLSASAIGSNTLAGLYYNDDDNTFVVIQGGSAPADADTTWQRVEITGAFAGIGTTTITLVRSATASSVSGVRRIWTYTGGAPFASGNIYTCNFYKA